MGDSEAFAWGQFPSFRAETQAIELLSVADRRSPTQEEIANKVSKGGWPSPQGTANSRPEKAEIELWVGGLEAAPTRMPPIRVESGRSPLPINLSKRNWKTGAVAPVF